MKYTKKRRTYTKELNSTREGIILERYREREKRETKVRSKLNTPLSVQTLLNNIG